VALLVRHLRSAAGPRELTLSEASALGRLVSDGPATTADLARAEGIKPQSMRTTLAALEKMGHIEREPHPTDGRQVYLKATPKGEAVRQSMKDAKRSWLAAAIGQLDKQEREALFAATGIIKRLVER
jgi:DNA-binding MarR family transcriptional regulator